MKYSYRDLLANLVSLSETELDMEVKVGMSNGVVTAHCIDHCTDPIFLQDADGDTLLIECSGRVTELEAGDGLLMLAAAVGAH